MQASDLEGQRVEARRLWLAALDQKAELRLDSTLALLRISIRADTTFLPALRDYLDEMHAAGRGDDARREFPEPHADAGVLAHCRAAMARGGFEGDFVAIRAMLERLASRPDPSGCTANLSAYHSSLDALALRAAKYRAALSHDSEGRNAGPYAAILATMGRSEEAVVILLEGVRRSSHPLESLALHLHLVRLRRTMRDTASAAALLSAIGVAVARDGRPYLRSLYLTYVASAALQRGDVAAWDSLMRVRVALLHRGENRAAEFGALVTWGAELSVVANDPKKSIDPLTRAVALADRLGRRELLAAAYHARGRGFAKLGRFGDAERDLRTALVFADDPTSRAENHHQLAHVYEGQGRWGDAAREAARYSEEAWHVRETSAIYMMSLHDAGTIHWKAGWHASARLHFVRMVAVIDERQENHFYAGEYFERIGDFARAAAYYDRGARSPETGDLHLNLAGLTRMYLALGFTDSARATATRHDRRGQYAVTSLLPEALVADGRIEEAIALSAADVREKTANASPQLAVTSMLQHARVLLAARRHGDVRRLAARAEQLASRTNLTDEGIEAVRLQGIAEIRTPDAAIGTLLRGRALVRAHPTAAAERSIELALGDAFAAARRTDDALQAYDRAATASVRVTDSYTSVLDRARHHDQRVVAHDRALRLLLDLPASRHRSEEILRWSSRKKSAVLGGRAGNRARRTNGVGPTYADLDAGAALVDYIAVDSTVAALVVTSGLRRVVKLPLTAAATAALVARLRAPLVAADAGNIDLARAPFDLAIAHELYVGLFAPLEPLIKRAQRIVIVPDGPVSGVPFSALPRAPPVVSPDHAPYRTADYLIDHFEITLAVWAGEPSRSAPRRAGEAASVLVVQGPVAGGARERQSIVDAWPPGRVKSLRGVEASEGALKRSSSRTAIIHFALHARADEDDPLGSYLQLAPNREDDGYLHVSEIAALTFQADLVVLTACETLPGRVFAGTGPFGVASAFIASGASGVIATHWLVGESAAELSGDLHRGLARGLASGAALRAAQLELRRDPRWSHPFYWGGYVLMAATPD